MRRPTGSYLALSLKTSGLPQRSDRRDSTLRIVARDIGALQVGLSAALLLPLGVSLLYREFYSALAFFAASAITAALGSLVVWICRDVGDPKRHHALLIAGAGWLVTAIFGGLPFLLAAYWTPPDVAQSFVPANGGYDSSLFFFRNPLHAFFESMSAFTTTGLTMTVHEPSIGHGLLFYRSLAQWIGGAGVIVLSLAIIPRPHAVSGLELYQSEATGMKLRPSILGTARAIWKVYAGLTFAVAIYLFIATIIVLPEYGLLPSLFDAVNHAMTGLATGGFSTLDDSIAGFNSSTLEYVHIPPMVLGMISLPLYYLFFSKRDVRVLWRDAQFRSMIGVFAVLTPFAVLLLWGNPAVAAPFREGLFQVVSGVSGTGWQTSSIGDWGASAVLLLAWGGMIVSGMAGSTVGGIKLIRAYILTRAVRWRIRKVFLPGDAVVPFRIGERSMPTAEMQKEVADAAILSFLYLVILFASVLIAAALVSPDFTLADVIFESVSAQSTVGLSTGITNPGMPVTVQVLFIFQMWAGRLEIFPVIVLLRGLFWLILRR